VETGKSREFKSDGNDASHAKQQDILKREQLTRRRSQASHVHIWEERHPDNRISQVQVATGVFRGEIVTAYVKNYSDQPVYDVEVRWYQDSPENHVESSVPAMVLMPDGKTESSHSLPQDNGDQFGATLRFRDANQVRWNRYPDGQLFEAKE
jgi:hypothetical protein